jgi:uncharacterized protein (TIGR03435 family)
MKTLTRLIIALAVLSGSALFAQSLVGTWQGTLQIPQANRELRMVFKISTTDADSLKTVVYSIDQPAPPIPASTTTLQGSVLKITIPGIGGSYEGKVSADSNSIAGSLTQGPAPLPLNLTRATNETAWVIPEPPPAPKAMAANADPAFEVATIKPSKPDARMSILVNPQNRQFTTTGTSLSALITFAYGLHPRQLTGGPAWLETEKYDIVGKPDTEGLPNDKQIKTMMQKLLADRFKVTFHHDKKELSVYTINVGKDGPKLTKSARDMNGLYGAGFRGLGKLVVTNATIADLAGIMQNMVMDRPVVDQTGITGRWDFSLNWTPDETQFNGRLSQLPPPASGTEADPDLYTAIQKQLGLKLEATKAPTDVLVIDHVEKPSDN